VLLTYEFIYRPHTNELIYLGFWLDHKTNLKYVKSLTKFCNGILLMWGCDSWWGKIWRDNGTCS